MKTKALILALMVLAVSACSNGDYTRGIGVYPGKVEDYTGPEIIPGVDGYRNLAQNRAAWHSSSYDYNLTAQLATDGIISSTQPVILSVETSDGPVDKLYRDLLFDGHDKRMYPVKAGKNAFVRAQFKNATIDYDKVTLETDCGTFKVEGKDGIFTAKLPQKAISSNGPADEIKLKLMHFYKDDEEISVYTGEFFTSCWIPAGTTDEWIYVDLGASSDFDKIVLYWIGDAPAGSIEISEDTQSWNAIAQIPVAGERAGESLRQEVDAGGKGRYVRISVSECAGGEPCALSEIQVWGRGGVQPKATRQPKAEGGILNLRGGNWKLQRASLADADGATISTEDFDDSDWLIATVPGTVATSYLNDGAIPDQRFDADHLQISESFFLSDFWYRDSFTVPASFSGSTLLLNFEGINWKADVWVNGTKAGRIEGAFKRGQFDVTSLIVPGQENSIAVLIHRNAHPGGVKEQTRYSADSNGGALGADNATFHPTVGWDWIPTVRGRGIGIWNDVTISAHAGGVSIDNPFVVTDLPLPSTDFADINATVDVQNHSAEPVEGTLVFKFGHRTVRRDISLAAAESATVELPSFRIDNPELWWPAGYGEPHLYDASIEFICGGRVSDRKEFKTGIREMSYDDADGSLDVYINGRRLIGNGGNWGFPEINLNYRAREYDIAVAYHADMGFNLIRNWVGQTGDQEFYEACDRHGVMVWQDFWLANPWDGPDPYYEDMFMDNASDYILRTRNHPCIAFYCGRNEGMPPASIDLALRQLVAGSHPCSHYIPHSAALTVSGYGPYRAIGPDAYFALEEGRSTLHSERGMPNVMSYEGIRRMLREPNQWPQNSIWGLHDYVLDSAQGCITFNGFIEQAFGEPSSLEQFARWAQWINYDGYRAMYESRSWERKGLLIWMSHACWPSMVWQTYDYWFEPTAAYFGAKKACAPIRIQYNPVSSEIEVVNNSAGSLRGLTASVAVLDIMGSTLWSSNFALDSAEDTTLPLCPLDIEAIEGLTDVYYIKLGLYDAGKPIADNFYVRGKEYGNFKALLDLGEPSLNVHCKFHLSGGEYRGTAILSNIGDVPALMTRLCVVRSNSGEQILPVIYEDNYISLLPGESRSVEISFKKEDTGGEKPVLIWQPGV